MPTIPNPQMKSKRKLSEVREWIDHWIRSFGDLDTNVAGLGIDTEKGEVYFQIQQPTHLHVSEHVPPDPNYPECPS